MIIINILENKILLKDYRNSKIKKTKKKNRKKNKKNKKKKKKKQFINTKH